MPFSLARALSPYVAAKTRARGADYFTAGAVVRLDRTATGVDAVVRGSQEYPVALTVDRNTVYGACACAYFMDRLDACKHIWAVIAACDARAVALFPQNTREESIWFEPLDTTNDDTRDDDADDADDRIEQLYRPTAPRQREPIDWRAHRPGDTRARGPEWRQSLERIRAGAYGSVTGTSGVRPFTGQLLYIVDLAASQQAKAVVVQLMHQERKRNGEWSAPKVLRLSPHSVNGLPDDDRLIVERLVGARASLGWSWSSHDQELGATRQLSGWLALELLPLICATGRGRLAATQYAGMPVQQTLLTPLAWDAAEPWTAHIRVQRDETDKRFIIDGEMRRGDERLRFSDIVLLLDEGLLLTWTVAARCRQDPALLWARELRLRPRMAIPVADKTALRDTLLQTPPSSADLPQELRTEVRRVPPTPRLTWSPSQRPYQPLEGRLSFSYGGSVVAEHETSMLVPTANSGVVVARDTAAEQIARVRLAELGIKPSSYPQGTLTLPASASLGSIASQLLAEGWQIESSGHEIRLPAGVPALHVTSGIDWFDLEGFVDYGDQRVALPALLAALTRGDDSISLGDGAIGIVPAEWRRQYSGFGMGRADNGRLRFSRPQAALLDALLAERPAVSWDDAFADTRAQLTRSATIAPLDPPPGFVGVLRGYQREGLGWLIHLQRLRLGGCLADDMGLGKTVMVLAMLECLRSSRTIEARPRPSLVVAPRSVIFNWMQEAARFTPGLQLLDYSTTSRRDAEARIDSSDLVLTTYGMLRKDAPALAAHHFACVILDEAQTIKNATTVTAKSVRLLNADHRLALSGTPVENRLGDLWSIFEFLNPGLLSNASQFTKALAKDAGDEQLRVLGRGLRPFILRRTKEQVAADLPAKVEQTLVCELDRRQRALYDELRDHYRGQLLNPRASWQKKRLQVLEALLRLRQAACHPGLVNADYSDDASAKLDLLVPRLQELLDEGHKTLVFSQFTSFLALLRRTLDEKGMAYEYLDGRTRDRQARVERFQQDPGTRLFLISLKAGGLGLNLTAADYVFLLDPWWNPAVEAQAIDRSHRIGQTRHVFAYRLVAKDTVEERVLELQQKKRTLADAILTEDNSVVKNLTREELDLLLS